MHWDPARARLDASSTPRGTGSAASAPRCGGLRTLALVGSHGPRMSGLVTFSVDLGEALSHEWPSLDHLVVAVSERTRRYPAAVRMALAPTDVSSYRRAADYLNDQDVDLVSVQHEPGLHGGAGGGHLLALLRELRMPVVTTLHALDGVPDRSHRAVIDEIVRRSERVVVTSARAARLVREVHRVVADKVDHIPGGADVPSPAVARAYGRCFERARAEHAQRRWQAADRPSLADRVIGVPPLELGHLARLTDGAGAAVSDPDLVDRAVDSVDDNARALALMALLEQLGAGDRWMVSVLASRYLAALADRFDAGCGRFRTLAGGQGPIAAEDSHARGLWALGAVVGRGRDRGRDQLAAGMFRAAAPAVLDFTEPTACAYALLGLAEYQRSFAADMVIKDLQRLLADRLKAAFTASRRPGWAWFEDRVGPDAARLPQALLVIGRRLGDDAAVAIGGEALAWLLDRSRGKDGGFVPGGGVDPLGRVAAQRPLEACAAVSACLAALRVTGEARWADDASRAFAWFLGANSARRSVYDPRTGGCHDGVYGDRIGARQGAEATLAFLLAATEVRSAAGAVADQARCDLGALAHDAPPGAERDRAAQPAVATAHTASAPAS